MRLFFAVNLTHDIKRGIRDAIDRFPVQKPPWRWVREDNLHITLKFLGEMEPGSISGLITAAEEACAGRDSFELSFSRFGAFPNLRKPRVLFFSAERGEAQLKSLAGALEESLHRHLGIERERRPFRSHITVARVKRPLSRDLSGLLERVPPLEGLSQEVGTISLMESELRPSGAVYRVVKEIALS